MNLKRNEIANKKVLVYNDMEKVREESSNFSKKLSYKIDGSTYYLMALSDNHNNLEPFLNALHSASYFDNMGVVLLGDQAKVSLPNSKTPSFEAKPLQVEMDTTKYAFDKSGLDVQNQLLAYIDGNHEEREKQYSSLEIGKSITTALNVEDRYAENTALLTLEFKDPLRNNEPIKVVGFLNHGQGRGGGPGAEADKSLNCNFVKGSDFIIQGDTHKIVNANEVVQEFDPGCKTMHEKERMFINFGTDLAQEEYLMKKCIPLRPVRDGEILKFSLVPNKEGTASEVVVDYINIRQVLTEKVTKNLSKLEKKLGEVEQLTFYSTEEIDTEYNNLISSLKKDKSFGLEGGVKNKISSKKTIRLVVLSGLNIGSKNAGVGANLDELVKTIKELKNCYVIINGDAIHYKKANLLHRINYPEDTFAYLQELAQKLEPIKEKIIAYNSGDNEYHIMKTEGNAGNHSRDLAEIAMKNIQLDEKYAFEDMSAKDLKIEIMKIQNHNVRLYNEKILDAEYKKYAFDLKQLYALGKYKKRYIDNDKTPFTDADKVAVENWTKDDIKEVLVFKLRKEDVLLDASTKKGKARINQMFPLSTLEVKQPNKNLIQNILCKLLEINPKKIVINSMKGETCDNYIKFIDSEGRPQGVNIVTSYKMGQGTRNAVERSLQKLHNGAEIYVSNGDEYMTKQRESIVDAQGNFIVQDVIHISGGDFSKENSSVRIYEIRSEKTGKRISGGLFEDTNETTLTCSSKNPKTALMESIDEDVRRMYCKMITASYQRKLEEYNMQQLEMEKERKKSKISKQIFTVESEGRE